MSELYHYTTGAGLLGMLKDYDADKDPNLTMWATHYAYMNDPTEYMFGINLCLPLIKEIEEEEGVPEEDKIYPSLNEAKDLPKYWGVLELKHWEFRGIFNPYIISFSQARDSLHMWNMYGQNGNGLALCLDMDRIRLDKTHYLFDSCVYAENEISIEDKEKIKDKIRPFYTERHDAYKEMKHRFRDEQQNIAKTFLFAPFIYAGVASYVKHRAYIEEREYRMLAYGSKDTFFRERNGEIVPYKKENIAFEALQYIIVGPTRDFERTRNSILLLFGQKGISWSPEKIIQSEVPYNG